MQLSNRNDSVRETLTPTPALSPRRGRIIGSLLADSPLGEFAGIAANAM
jgi:hypothetical protein